MNVLRQHAEHQFSEELAELKKPHQIFELNTVFREEFFETKKVVYVPL